MDSEFYQKLYKSRITLLEYIKSLGYSTGEYENFSHSDIINMHNSESLDMHFKSAINIYCKYYTGKALRAQYIEEIVDDLFNLEGVIKEKDTLVIISKDISNDTIKKYLIQLLTDRKIFIVNIGIKELQFNVLNHVLVPKHTILNNEEANKVKTTYNIDDDKSIPEISRYDAVSKAIMLRPTQIVKIERPSKNSIYSEYYRFCINN